MGTVSDIIGAAFLIVVGLALWKAWQPSKRNTNKIDGSIYDDVE